MSIKQDKKFAKEFRDRWKAVEAIEAEEQKSASIELRWKQLNSIFRMAIGMGLPARELCDEDIKVYERWVKLRRLMK